MSDSDFNSDLPDDNSSGDTYTYSDLNFNQQYDLFQRRSTKIKKCLSELFSVEQIERNTVCVAGSAPLQWLLLSLPLHSIPKGCLFQPQDVDIFIYGDDGRTQKAFTEMVTMAIENLEFKGYDVFYTMTRENLYILNDIPVLITDVCIRNIYHNRLSFVQCPTDSTKEDIVARFDIDIVKVMYDIGKQTIIVNEDVKRNILQGVAVSRDFNFGLSAPSARELYMMKQRLFRIEKYTSRGFHFTRVPKLLCNMSNVMTTPLAGMLPGYKPIEESEFVNETLDDVIVFMQEMFPMSELKNGTVGLFGELPLMKVLSDNESTLNWRIPGPWKVAQANICICGDDAKHVSSFKNRIGMLWIQVLTSFGYTTPDSYHVNEIVDGLGKRTYNAKFKVKELDVVLRFIRCPHAETCEDVAKSTKLGIEKVWYDFNSHTLQSCPDVMEQIKTAITTVDDIMIKGKTPNFREVKEIVSVIERMRNYHSQGFVFKNYPLILSCENI